MELMCPHCKMKYNGIIHLKTPIENYNSNQSNIMSSTCPFCKQEFTFKTKTGIIAISFSNDEDNKEHFDEPFDGQNIIFYETFKTIEDFYSWWLIAIKYNNIPSMWYHVLYGSEDICWGAMDPYDIDIFNKYFQKNKRFEKNLRKRLNL